jgi:hypothetical protein
MRTFIVLAVVGLMAAQPVFGGARPSGNRPSGGQQGGSWGGNRGGNWGGGGN